MLNHENQRSMIDVMSVKKYSYADQTQISPHFSVQEFKCRCGKNHDILISDELVSKLEQLRSKLNCYKIIITSGYRCSEHDRNVGGSGSGQHTKGTAADFVCYDKDGNTVSSKIVCCTAQDLEFGGIANITNSYDCTHADVRTGSKWYGNEIYGTGTVTDDFYSYFGIALSQSSDIIAKGIDVSYAQGRIDWDKVKNDSVEFALLRAGYGREISQIDSTFERNYSECKRLGIPVGAYWYSYATTPAEAQQEAKIFLKAISGKQFEYPVYMDLEESEQFNLGKVMCSELVDAFLTVIEQAGFYAGLYCSTSYLDSHITDSIKNRYTVWVAQYNRKCTYQNNYGIWQHSVAGHPDYDCIGKGKISGINGQCDLDYSYIDYPSLIKNSGLNGFPKNEPIKDAPAADESKDALNKILEHIASIDKKLM